MVMAAWKKLPQGLRRVVGFSLKAALTIGAFYLLLTHSIDDESGNPISISQAIADHLVKIELAEFLP